MTDNTSPEAVAMDVRFDDDMPARIEDEVCANASWAWRYEMVDADMTRIGVAGVDGRFFVLTMTEGNRDQVDEYADLGDAMIAADLVADEWREADGEYLLERDA